MPNPIARAARRQNAVDELAELLTGWGCPDAYVADRARTLLAVVESHGWRPPEDPPPLRGPGSTDEGRARARRIAEQTRAGCTCGPAWLGLLSEWHSTGCPVRRNHDAQRAPAVGGRSDEHPPPGISTPSERDGLTSERNSGARS